MKRRSKASIYIDTKALVVRVSGSAAHVKAAEQLVLEVLNRPAREPRGDVTAGPARGGGKPARARKAEPALDPNAPAFANPSSDAAVPKTDAAVPKE